MEDQNQIDFFVYLIINSVLCFLFIVAVFILVYKVKLRNLDSFSKIITFLYFFSFFGKL